MVGQARHLAALDETSPSPAPQHRILLVDDNRDIADVLALLLGKAGNIVEKAHDGLTALAVASRFRPTVAILDIGLPDMSGHELAQRLRKQKGLAGLKLVAMTGYGRETDRKRSKRAGFTEHLAKPVGLEQLLGTIERISEPAMAERPVPRRRAGSTGTKALARRASPSARASPKRRR